MGYTSYSNSSRDERVKNFASSTGVNMMRGASLSASDTAKVFKQNALGHAHESMSPMGLQFRECRDSETHPQTVSIIVALDVTGSMGKIPKDFVANGLPTMMSTIIQRGTLDASVCFLAIGDHESDKAPVQVGQFESGDAELDLWLTRTWLEGNGGGNDGESYALAWYTAARHTKTDSCEKRNTKGFLFTIGDEPVLPNYPASALKGIYGESEMLQGNITAEQILKEAQSCYNVYHIALGHRGEVFWKSLLGQNYLMCDDYTKIPKLIAEIIASYNASSVVNTPSTDLSTPAPTGTDTPIML